MRGKTELVLDQFTGADAPIHVTGEDDEHARRFGWFPLRSTEATVEDAIARWRRDWAIDGPTRAFAARVDQRLVGGCELRRKTEETWALSYWVFPEHRRKGYGTTIASLAVAFAFDELGAISVQLEIEPDNVGSRRVAEKAGFALTGTTAEQTQAGIEREMLVYSRARS